MGEIADYYIETMIEGRPKYIQVKPTTLERLEDDFDEEEFENES